MSQEQLVFLDADSIGDDIAWPDFSAFGQVVKYGLTAPADVSARVKDATFIFTNKVPITAEHMAAAPRLRYIGILATGYNLVDIQAAADRGIPVCNVPAYSTPSVAQHVFALLLALTSGLCELSTSVREGAWAKCPQFCYWFRPIVELDDKTLGIVGYGDIGRQVARIANALSMKVLAYNPRPKPAPDFGPFAFVELDELFRESDAVTLHCPLTPDNAGMINAKLLGSMKKSAYLINTARGPLVNEQDLCEALHKGEIAGAGLDVVSVEPMTADNPLRLAPNCIITPHIAWAGRESRIRLMRGVYDNIRNFLAGKPSNVQNGVTAG